MFSEYSIFLWLNWKLSVEELVEKWSNLLPAAIKIIDSDLANLDPRLKIKNNSIYFATSIEKSERVWMSCNEGIHLSIPLTCPVQFYQINKQEDDYKGNSKLIKEIVEINGFIGSKIKVIDPLDELAQFGELQFLNSYIATYLNAFPLNAAGDVMTCGEQIFLPTYYKIKVDVAQPLTNQIIKNKFFDILPLNKSSPALSNFKQEIEIFHDNTEDNYDLIQHVNKNASSASSLSQSITNISPPLPPRNRHLTHNIPITDYSNSKKNDNNILNSHEMLSMHHSLKNIRKNHMSNHSNTNSQISLISQRKVSRSNDTINKIVSQRKSAPTFATLIKRFNLFKPKKANFDDKVFLELNFEDTNILDNQVFEKSPNDDTYDKIGSPKNDIFLHRLSTSESAITAMSPIQSEINLIKISRSEKDLANATSCEEDSIEEIYEYPYFFDEQQHSSHKNSKSSNENNECLSISKSIKFDNHNSNFYKVKWPVDVSVLSVKEVCRCLHLLNLDAYEKNMENEQVDGQLLQILDESILCSHFNMRRIDALKLFHFANHGWRPKI